MAEFIAESPRLLRLDLRENEIKTGGLMALSLALKVNTSLLRLDLDREPKKETVSTEEGGRPRVGNWALNTTCLGFPTFCLDGKSVHTFSSQKNLFMDKQILQSETLD